MNAEIALLLRLAAAQLALQLLLSLLARAIARPVPWRVATASHLLPWVLLAPWIAGSALLVPTGTLANQIPGLQPVEQLDPHSIQLNDVVLAILPWELEVRHALAARQLPFWSDVLDGGSSPWANPQTSIFSPVSMLARLAPIQHHLLFALALKIAVAFQGTWLAARRFGIRPAGAWIAAAGHAVCGGVLAWALFPLSTAVAWAPWNLAAAVRVVRNPSRQSLIATAATFLMLLLSGHPEVAFGAALLSGLVAIVVARRSTRVRSVALLFGAGLLGSGLAAPLVVPFLGAVPPSQRVWDFRDPTLQAPTPEEIATGFPAALTPRFPNLLTAPLSPWRFGVPYRLLPSAGVEPIHIYACYSGLTAVVGAAGLLLTGAMPRRALAPAAYLVSVLLLFAGVPALLWIWARLPVLHLIVANRLVALSGLCLSILGGLGIDRIFRHPRRAPPLIVILIVFGASLALAPSKSVLVIGFAAFLSVLVARRWPGAALAILLLALLCDQVQWGRHLLPRGEASLFYPRTPEIEQLKRLSGEPFPRAVGHDFLAYPNVLAVYGISDPRVNNPLASARYLEVLGSAFDYRPSALRYFSHFLAPEHPFLDFLGVPVVYSNAYLPEIPGMPTLRLPGGVFHFARNLEALPRWILVTRFQRVSEGDLGQWIRDLDRPDRVAIPVDAPSFPEEERSLVGGPVQLVTQRPGRLSLAFPAAGIKLLASSVPGPSGWRVESARGEVTTLTVNGAFLGVLVPPGIDRIDLVYRPPGLMAGLAIAGLSALALLTLTSRWPRLAPTLRARSGLTAS